MYGLSVCHVLLCMILYLTTPVVYSQTLTLTVETSSLTYGNDVTLKCLYSGPTCCSSSTRYWTHNGMHIMYDGVPVDTTKKYTERVNDAGHYFELKIFNLKESDFGKAFECQYSFLTSNSVTLTRDISHGPLTLSVETSQSNCRTEVKLKCLYFGPTCCTDDARVWSRNGTQIMNNGYTIDNTKYEEERNDASHYFVLKILNLEDSDFGKSYQCQYNFYTSNSLILTKDITNKHSLCDLCPSNWTRFADSCYYPSTHGQVHNFHTAATFCNGHSSHLVEIDSPEEQVFMEKLINKTNSLHDFWNGANDIDHEGIWKWNGSNTVLNYRHWCTGEPNNALQGEDCAALNVNNIPGKNFCWNDYSCKSYHNFVCEKSILAVSTTTNTYTLPTGTLVWRTVARK